MSIHTETSALAQSHTSTPNISRGRGTVQTTRQFISSAMLRYELTRLWALSLLGAAVLLISGPVVALLSPAYDHTQPSLMRVTPEDGNPGLLAYQILAPIVFALALFTYLDASGRVSIVHAFPVTRGTIFRTHVIAGLILLYLPHILVFLTLFPFVRPGWSGFTTAHRMNLDGHDVHQAAMLVKPNYADLLRWFLVTSVIMLFIFATAVLAAIITGNLGIGILMTLFINVIVPVLYGITLLMLNQFLYGFSNASFDAAAWMHPLFDLAMNGARISLAHLIWFMLLSLLLLFASSMFHRRLRSEHAGANMMFDSAKTVTTILVTFVGACIIGIILQALQPNNIPALSHHVMFFLGVILSSPVIFMIISMIVNGTIAVFTLKNFQRYIAFAMIIIIYFAFTTWDVTGYTKRVPQTSNVSAVSLSDGYTTTLPYAGSYYWQDLSFKDRTSIDDVRALHTEIIERSKDSRYAPLFNNSSATGSWPFSNTAVLQCTDCFAQSIQNISFTYHQRGAGTLTRNYQVYGKYLMNSPAYTRLINDEGYKKANDIASIGYGKITSASLSDAWGSSPQNDDKSTIMNAQDAQHFARLLDEDYHSLPAMDISSLIINTDASTGALKNKKLLITLTFNLATTSNDDSKPSSFSYGLTKDYTRSIQWLKAKGLYQTLLASTTH